jgi:glucose-6-phosphate 1-dehydrogenase
MTATNEVEHATAEERGAPAPPCAIVIYGATGDLTKRKLIPALYNLAVGGLLSRDFAIVAFARQDMSDDSFREAVRSALSEFATGTIDGEVAAALIRRAYYCRGEFGDDDAYRRLGALLAKVDKECGTRGNCIHYLATPPSSFSDIVRRIGAAGLAAERDGRFRRVVIEKPFGRDLDSARALNREIRAVLDERQIYRIDHYLGKETVQNLMAFRFANGIFEPIWNRRYIDNVQITVAETLGVEGRGGYYEEAGALRDMVSNHLLQIVSLIAMEPPIGFDADAVRDEKSKALRAVKPIVAEKVLERVVRGQYGAGSVDGERAPAYRDEPRVARDSPIDTFVAMKLQIDNWRWADVPFYLRTGKRLPKRLTEVVIQFKRAPFVLFRDTPVERLSPNLLVVQIQPKEGISLRFAAKVPGAQVRLKDVDMQFRYADFFGVKPNTGYETLLYDCMVGDATLFMRADDVEAAWAVVSPILDVWRALTPRAFPNYASGTWGPREADELLERDGRRWRTVGA